jgi:hypothetical protein
MTKHHRKQFDFFVKIGAPAGCDRLNATSGQTPVVRNGSVLFIKGFCSSPEEASVLANI